MSNLRFVPILALVAAAQLAVWADVQAFPAKGVELSAYKTYKILPPKVMTKSGLQENEPTVSPLIIAALRNELSKKGLTEVAENPDLEIQALGAAVSIPQIEALIFSYTIDTTAVTGTAPVGMVGRYNKEGTLYVNFIDPKTNKSTWLGITTRALGKPSNLETDINKATQALFKKYPALK